MQASAKEAVELLTQVRTVADGPDWQDDWISMCFLNAKDHDRTHIKSVADVRFPAAPSGATDIRGALQKHISPSRLSRIRKLVSRDKSADSRARGTWIGTDGSATDSSGRDDMPGLYKFMTKHQLDHPDHYFTIGLMTDDREITNTYEGDFDEIRRVDVMQIYRKEKAQVQAKQNAVWRQHTGETEFPYTKQDHLVKLVLGPYYPFLDELDDKPLFEYDIETYLEFRNAYSRLEGSQSGLGASSAQGTALG
jgi:hypothetical protein